MDSGNNGRILASYLNLVKCFLISLALPVMKEDEDITYIEVTDAVYGVAAFQQSLRVGRKAGYNNRVMPRNSG